MSQDYGLGRGLASLIPQKNIKDNSKETLNKTEETRKSPTKVEPPVNDANDTKDKILHLEIEKVKTNPFQPRVHFNPEKLKELAQSIKNYGIIQPLVVTRKGDDFELIAGERRLQAAKEAGLKSVPVIVRNAEGRDKLELAIIENIQRHNLNPIEEAMAYEKLMEEFHLTQEIVAERVGKSRSVIANKLRLLDLPDEIKEALVKGDISEGHAKAILFLTDKYKRLALLDIVMNRRLSVRQTEEKSKEMEVKKYRRKVTVDPEVLSLENQLTERFGARVKVKKAEGSGGKIVIDYYSQEELDKILKRINSEE